MTLEQIDCFICAAQSRTFFDAAEAMHISQSSLSKQIMKLEKELELTLWDRSKRTAVLTPEGEFFYKEALKISRQYHRSLEAVYHFKDSKLQALHIGTLPFLSQYHLTSVIHSFCNTHPELLRTARAESIVSAVEIGEGISLLTKSNFQLFRQPSLAAVPVNGLEKLSVGIAHKKNMALTTSAECFLQFVKSHM